MDNLELDNYTEVNDGTQEVTQELLMIYHCQILFVLAVVND